MNKDIGKYGNKFTSDNQPARPSQPPTTIPSQIYGFLIKYRVMELDFGKIARIKDIQVRLEELSEEGKNLSSPLLTDIRLVREIYDIFSGMVENPSSAAQRKKFIFIILYLFSPGTLAGGKMASGLREAIANAIGVKSHSSVSNNSAGMLFIYRHYEYFRKEVGRIFTEVTRRLEEKGLISVPDVLAT